MRLAKSEYVTVCMNEAFMKAVKIVLEKNRVFDCIFAQYEASVNFLRVYLYRAMQVTLLMWKLYLILTSILRCRFL